MSEEKETYGASYELQLRFFQSQVHMEDLGYGKAAVLQRDAAYFIFHIGVDQFCDIPVSKSTEQMRFRLTKDRIKSFDHDEVSSSPLRTYNPSRSVLSKRAQRHHGTQRLHCRVLERI